MPGAKHARSSQAVLTERAEQNGSAPVRPLVECLEEHDAVAVKLARLRASLDTGEATIGATEKGYRDLREADKSTAYETSFLEEITRSMGADEHR
jgi:hypothetical protein